MPLPVAETTPPVTKLPAVTLPVAVINPAVPKLPTFALPDTETDVNVPTDVTLGCDAVVNEPATVVNTPLVAPILPRLALPDALNVPETLAPVVVTTTTFAVPPTVIAIFPLALIAMLELPLACGPTKFPPVILPVAVIKPAVPKLPTLAFPDTETEVNVPTDVILGCAAVVTVPAVVADPAEPALVAYVALATVPVTLPPGILVNPAALPVNTPVLAVILAAVRLPFTPKLVNVPTDVILGCAAVVTVPAVVADPALVAYVALATVPVTLPPANALKPLPLPVNTPVLAVMLTPVIVPFTPSDVNVPTDVMLGCAAVVTVPAVVADPALAA